MTFTGEQSARLREYAELLLELNRRLNLISREDEPNVFEHHIRHCLTLASRPFPAGATIVDWGTGGGLPAIPLAIAFPDVQIVGVDAVEKKVQAVRLISRRLHLSNVQGWHGRAETYPGEADYSVSRATAPLGELWSWHSRSARLGEDVDGCWRRGLICLKGGDLNDEIAAARMDYPGLHVASYPVQELLSGPYFREKVILECWRDVEPEGGEHR